MPLAEVLEWNVRLHYKHQEMTRLQKEAEQKYRRG